MARPDAAVRRKLVLSACWKRQPGRLGAHRRYTDPSLAIAVSVIRFCSTAVTNFCAWASVTCPGMVTLAQLTRLEARIDALANSMIPSPRIRYHVEIGLDSALRECCWAVTATSELFEENAGNTLGQDCASRCFATPEAALAWARDGASGMMAHIDTIPQQDSAAPTVRRTG